MSPPSPLRLQLDRYVRSLLERSDHPERQQDLGTFVTWLLGRMGFTLRLLPFHYAGPQRRVSKGRFQGGIDLVASRPRADGSEDLYLFVLKRGDVGRSEWRSEDGIRADLDEVEGTRPETHDKWLPPDSRLGKVVVVAAHNGELDMERLAEHRRTYHERFERHGFGFEWWSAVELVDHALAMLGGAPDDQLFPPMVRPFYGVLLDDLRTSGQVRSDAIDRLLDARLPLDEPIERDELERALTEISLFVAILASMDEEQSRGLLELLDALIRLITRCMAKVVEAGETSEPVQGALVDLLGTFVGAGDRLADILDPIIEIPDGLALMRDSECVDWPLRTVRLVRDLVLTTRVAKDLDEHYSGRSRGTRDDTERRVFKERADEFNRMAERSAERSSLLAEHNWGGMATPITDDQLVEYAIIWRTWLEHGKTELAKTLADQMLSRLVLRRYSLRFPGPALYSSAGTPMPEGQARVLAEGWSGLHPVELEDGGSTLIPVVLLVAWRLGVQVDETAVAKFGDIQIGERNLPPVHLQSWSPPADAPRRWYGTSLRKVGVCRIHPNDKLAPFLAQLTQRQPRLDPSPASTLGLPAIDALAWVRWRTRPPLQWLVDVLPDDVSTRE